MGKLKWEDCGTSPPKQKARPYLKINHIFKKKRKGTYSMVSAVEHLPNKDKALSSNGNVAKKYGHVVSKHMYKIYNCNSFLNYS
jgi:hypothetical protein